MVEYSTDALGYSLLGLSYLLIGLMNFAMAANKSGFWSISLQVVAALFWPISFVVGRAKQELHEAKEAR